MVPGLRLVCRLVLWVSTGITVREWAAVHRKHHAFTDRDGDPHSPWIQGFARVQIGNVVLYKQATRDEAVVRRYARDLPPDRWDRILFDHSVLGLGVGVGLLFAVFDGAWLPVVIAASVHTFFYIYANSTVNALGHRFGRRPFEVRATNNQWLAWCTFGEGLHANHHAAPTSARLALHPREVDPAWWTIWLGRKLGWMSIRHSEPKLTAGARGTPGLL